MLGGLLTHIRKEEAKIVKEIFDLYLEKRSLLSVAIALNEKDRKTKAYTALKGNKFGGIKFKSTNIQLTIKNVFYIGKVSYRGKLYDGEQERIISDEVFQKAQTILANNRRERKIAGTTKNIGLLNHILRCKACDSTMYIIYTMKGKHKYQYYLCMSAQKRGYNSCPTRLVAAQSMENKVMTCLRQISKESKLDPKTWDTLTLEEQTSIIRSLVKQASYDAHNEILDITLQDGKTHSFTVRLRELKRIPQHKRQDGEIAKEPAIRQNLVLASQISQTSKEKGCSLRQIAKWAGIPLPKICEIANMLNMSPKIQEEIMLSQDKRLYNIAEYRLRPIIFEIDWSKQQQIWDSLLKSVGGQA